MKKSVSVISALLLTAVMLVTVFLPVTAAGAATVKNPVVYVRGQGSALYDAKGEQIYPVQVKDGYIGSKIFDCLPSFLAGLTTDNWDKYCDKLYEAVYPVFKKIALDENGEVSDGSHVDFTWSRNSLPGAKGGKYELRQYFFEYDWRLDPFTVAAQLQSYIKDVLAVTGASKVDLISRCEGCCVTQAYLKKYGMGYIDDYILYSQAVSGVNTISGTFSGKMELSPEGVDRYTDYYLDVDNKVLDDFLHASIDLAASTYGINIAANLFNSIYAKVYANILPRLVRATYGTMPGIWAMVANEDYEEAIQLNFAGLEEEYSGLIKKLDYYHSRVRVNFESDLKKYQNAGMSIANITKYGFQNMPLFKNSNEISDGSATLEHTSIGAVCGASVDEALDSTYVTKRRNAGFGDYISKDYLVDASTCLLKNTTWFIKGLEHKTFPTCVDELQAAFFNSDGKMTVFTNSSYPQFMVYNSSEKTIVPMTEENCGETTWTTNKSFLSVLKRFFKTLFAFLNRFLASI